ncbi:putative s-adenosylmethionine-dependent methyltransferase-like protein [Erysiphe neolycopersici]|uniref:Putative s-adenosylmethionine-dependent methyltransferase-like protein n=1 Tax=Erysiphe neolycopersici TaxID=212602 RepID=A0A420I5H5_9PEZI|nr:putative s-adenosylmethionine-dependent methyltransferase-like protein [Erysiphe neolycopersici]
MSLLGRNSSSNRPKNTSNEHYSCHSAPDLNAAPTEEGRLTPLSDNSRDQFNHSSSSSGPSVSPPLSSRVSSPYTHRLLHSSILSLDDLNKCHSSPSQQHHPVQTPPTDQKKSKGFFDRMRTSSNRSSASEAKLSPLSSIGSRPNITRRITSQDTVQPTSRSIPNTNFTAEKQSAGNEVFQFPSLIDPSSTYEHSQSDSFDQSEQVDSVASLRDSTNRLLLYTEQNDPQSISRTSNPNEQRPRHTFRDSLLTSFFKVPNRLSGQSYETNQQQEHSSLRSSIWHRNSQSVSQISLISQEDPNSASVNSQNLDLSSQQHYLTPLNQHPQLEAQHMAPSSNSIISRKAADTKLSLQLQQETRDHSSPNYNRSQFSNHQPSAPGMSPSFQANQAQNNRSASQKEAYNSTQNEQKQNAAAPQVQERDINDNYKELVTKYKKVKGLYFEKTAQVEQLQNTLANQRLSQSRTSLDDSEYMTRFQRLEGAITNLAFNIRKDWQHVPGWLSQSVNHDAIKIGKHEMTAVGRAVITKFLVDEIFDQIFHPGLPMELSRSLKSIEKNIRKFSPAHNNHEESEALTARVMQWRLTTLDGLKDLLAPIESEEIKNQFIDRCTNNLTGLITSFLHEPNPPGIKDSAHIIVELAVSISSNLPLESRDLCISYPMPGNMLQPAIMKVENPIPSLGDTIADIDENEGTQSGDKDESGNDNEDSSQKVRFSGFISVEVRGRQILYKAPVWTMAKN